MSSKRRRNGASTPKTTKKKQRTAPSPPDLGRTVFITHNLIDVNERHIGTQTYRGVVTSHNHATLEFNVQFKDPNVEWTYPNDTEWSYRGKVQRNLLVDEDEDEMMNGQDSDDDDDDDSSDSKDSDDDEDDPDDEGTDVFIPSPNEQKMNMYSAVSYDGGKNLYLICLT
jgi:hypothetical protein